MKKLKEMKLKTAVILGMIFYAAAIIISLFIIAGIIPYTWVNGGMSKSYEAQASLSMINLYIMAAGILFTLVAGKMIPFRFPKIITGLCWFFVVYWTLSLILQLLGTPFEQFVISWTILLGLLSSLRLALEKR